MANRNVFISYRRGADSHAAGRLYDRLERIFGSDRLFYDVDSIPPGVDFHDHLDQQVAACDAFLVVIGPGWLAAADRLHDEDDFVRIEISSALERERIRIIPVLLQGARMPKRADLPEALHALARRNSVTVPDEHFSTVVDGRIASALREALARSSDEARVSPQAAEAPAREAAPARAPARRRDPPDPGAPARPARVFVREAVKLDGLGQNVSVAFSPNCRSLAFGSWFGPIRILNLATGNAADFDMSSSASDMVMGVAFSPDGRHLAAARGKTAALWDVGSRKRVAVLGGHGDFLTAVAFSPDGGHLATASGDRTARIWDVAARRQTARLAGHDKLVRAVAYSPDGSRVASTSDDGTARLWDPATGAQVALFEAGGNGVMDVAFAPDGRHMVTGSGDGMLRLWDIETGAMQSRLEGHEGAVWSVAVSPDGRYLASGAADTTVRLWDRAAGTTVAKLAVTSGRFLGFATAGTARSVAFSPDGARLAAGDDEGTVRVWDLSTG